MMLGVDATEELGPLLPQSLPRFVEMPNLLRPRGDLVVGRLRPPLRHASQLQERIQQLEPVYEEFD